ncbi:non-histone chromosomal protein HMG-14 isoform X3 [Callorhinus ursinus]|uniref:non-histone chromosomal protein HMG-14 isoform X3 n=1 Tax=Callorhinus ursinus TaxID=34884 RepID=UPI003CD0332F
MLVLAPLDRNLKAAVEPSCVGVLRIKVSVLCAGGHQGMFSENMVVRDKSSDKRVQTKGKRGAKGKQAEVANQETKEDLPAENGETKNEESPASDEAGEKEAKSD